MPNASLQTLTGESNSHDFSVELKSKESLRTLRIGGRPASARSQVVFEGTLGKISEIRLVEDSMLEIDGTGGTLRLERQEVRKLLGGVLLS